MEITIRVMTPQGERRISAQKGESLYSALRRGGIELDAPCGGHCFCGKCKVQPEPVGIAGEAEAKLLTEKELAEGYRLACAIKVEGEMTVRIPQLHQGQAEIMTAGVNVNIAVNHGLEWKAITLPEGTLEQPDGDGERLSQALGGAKLPLSVLKSLPAAVREDKGNISVLTEGDRVVDVRAGHGEQPLYGLAVDIGTTTIVAYLVDMVTGRELRAASMMNPQKNYGDDVISRIEYATQGGLSTLRDKVVEGINGLIDQLCPQGENDRIYRAMLVGNTVMVHLLVGVDPAHIAHSPFIPAFTGALELSAREAGLKIAPAAQVYTLPNVASYVGADIVASVMASQLDQREELTLMVDIGTNGEMVLGNKDRMLSCSTAAGPALEGAHISCGMGGVTGAISSVKAEGDQVICQTIGGAPARGLCGSGLVDAVALLLNSGALDETGHLDPDEGPEAWEDLFDYEGRNALFTLAEGERKVTLSQKDIREVQLAKGAIAAGIEVLVQRWGGKLTDIDRVCLAGGFGNYIDKANACRIGLLPQPLLSKIVGIGNGAGAGAKLALLSKDEMTRGEHIAQKVEYIELSAVKAFQDLFMEKMMFE